MWGWMASAYLKRQSFRMQVTLQTLFFWSLYRTFRREWKNEFWRRYSIPVGNKGAPGKDQCMFSIITQCPWHFSSIFFSVGTICIPFCNQNPQIIIFSQNLPKIKVFTGYEDIFHLVVSQCNQRSSWYLSFILDFTILWKLIAVFMLSLGRIRRLRNYPRKRAVKNGDGFGGR